MFIVILLIVAMAFVTNADSVQQTFWSLVPPVIAIALALITKEVYSSLFIGIITGALLYSGYNFEGTLTHIFNDGVIAVLSKSYNMGILVFLVILGIMVQLMNRTGGSAAFGNWATEKIKSREGAQLATIGLGCLIFIDDYFNCLTVGSVMRPVTDKHKISRAKLAYLIDATAAPVCIIAPISSWAAAVSGFVEGENHSREHDHRGQTRNEIRDKRDDLTDCDRKRIVRRHASKHDDDDDGEIDEEEGQRIEPSVCASKAQ